VIDDVVTLEQIVTKHVFVADPPPPVQDVLAELASLASKVAALGG
jgi:hypothetical protein